MDDNILKYIPQRRPFVMVDGIVMCDEECCRTEFGITEDCVMVEHGKLREAGVLENIAQTCASRIGYVSLQIRHEPIRMGVIGAVKQFKMYSMPRVGERLETEVVVVGEFFDMMVLDARVFCNGEVVASCEIKVALLN